MEDCIGLARKFGRTLAQEHDVPLSLGRSRHKTETRDLDWIREGECEKLEKMMAKPERKPDFGPAKPS